MGVSAGKQVRLLVEGWRGINHSFALVNQYQLLELRKYRGIELFHRDLPYVDPAWNTGANDAGFDAEKRAALATSPAAFVDPAGCKAYLDRADAAYRAELAKESGK
jgi:hypothetical protein